MLDWLASPEAWLALLTLVGIELILAVDNLLFISVVSAKLPPEQQNRARILGLSLAWVVRMAMLVGVVWVVQLGVTLFTVFGVAVTLESVLLLGGGAFLVGRGTVEIHQRLEGREAETEPVPVRTSVTAVVLQIGLLDAVFSLDSVFTAVGMTRHLGVMMLSATAAIAAMMAFAGPMTRLLNRTPTLRMLTLAFIILIGVNLIGEALGQAMPRGMIYFAMGFALAVEVLNLRAAHRKR